MPVFRQSADGRRRRRRRAGQVEWFSAVRRQTGEFGQRLVDGGEFAVAFEEGPAARERARTPRAARTTLSDRY
ncbi:hypothetical protein QQY66_03325 [Streptomyces sp. DG2A-72]|uniref:hypothetical protein n=1 Tax=Streptomyces sp. DG2A-72 TaxID=3051386 RepID=UPI00265BAE24|nr:hypothetical protein [Streptomyces sp. DG2A-72]MDO0930755.1 hypothetical protein [Streptomyces sp. DG2A-72]